MAGTLVAEDLAETFSLALQLAIVPRQVGLRLDHHEIRNLRAFKVPLERDEEVDVLLVLVDPFWSRVSKNMPGLDFRMSRPVECQFDPIHVVVGGEEDALGHTNSDAVAEGTAEISGEAGRFLVESDGLTEHREPFLAVEASQMSDQEGHDLP
ncbi:MAG: hypothetical protein OXC15_01725 [Rhodospirillaceae bacterium]|nr:hypothetical protein [Rhodospirillaceae bacterium]